jgi:alkylation response protein AidB-like acyl-CoA dehydrogenase
MDFRDSPSEAAFRDEVRAWLAEHLTGEFAELGGRGGPADETAWDTRVEWEKLLGKDRWLGLAWPEQFGGRAASFAEQVIFNEEYAKADAPARISLFGEGLFAPTLLAYGTEDQKHRFIPAMLRGEQLWCQLFSEPGAGSDLAGLTTRADRDGDEWVVNGQKVWNSFAHIADWGILLARTNWDVPKHRGITYFLVDMRTPGVEPRPLRQITGVAHFNETFLTDVRIPNDQIVGDVNGGWAVAQTTLTNERALIGGAAALGFRDYVELARHYGRDADPGIRQRLAAAYTRFAILRWLGQRAQAAARSGRPLGPESSVAKLVISDHAARNGDLALAIEGPAGMLTGRDAHEDGFWQQQFLGQWGIRIGGGTEQVQRNILGERVLGLPSEPRPDKTEPFRDIPKNG